MKIWIPALCWIAVSVLNTSCESKKRSSDKLLPSVAELPLENLNPNSQTDLLKKKLKSSSDSNAMVVAALEKDINHFVNYIESIEMQFQTKLDINIKNVPHNHPALRDKTASNHFFLDQQKASELKQKIESTRLKLLTYLKEDDIIFTAEIPLQVEQLESTNAKSWEEWKFINMPPAAIFPILSHYKANTKISELVILTQLDILNTTTK